MTRTLRDVEKSIRTEIIERLTEYMVQKSQQPKYRKLQYQFSKLHDQVMQAEQAGSSEYMAAYRRTADSAAKT